MKQAMIFAAGLGTRLRPLTDTMPKALVPVCGQPLLWHVIMRLRAEGFERIVVNVHHFAQQIVRYLEANDHFGLDLRISDESDRLLDTGGGIRKALPLFDPSAPILIHNVDILSNASLSTLYAQADTCDALLLVSHRSTTRYLLFDNDMHLHGWTNVATGEVKPPTLSLPASAFKLLAFSGIHVLSPRLISSMTSWPERFPIIDFYLDACSKWDIRGFNQHDLQLLDVGKPAALEQADQLFYKKPLQRSEALPTTSNDINTLQRPEALPTTKTK